MNNIDSKNSTHDINIDNFNIQIKIIAILGILISSLIFLSLISYSPNDEQNAQISVVDLFKLFTGDDELVAKVSTTKNWLGLAGAKLADKIYNGTVGYYAFAVPILMIYWFVFIYLRKKITRNLIKYTIIYFVLGLFFASFIGSLQHIDFLNSIPKEWSGSIGQFLSNGVISVIGIFGSIVIFAAGIIFVIYYSSEVTSLINTKINFNNFNFIKLFFTKKDNKSIITEENFEVNRSDNLNQINNESNYDIVDTSDELVDIKSIVLDINVPNSNLSSESSYDNTDPIVSILKSPKLNIKNVNFDDSIVSVNDNPFEKSAKNTTNVEETEINSIHTTQLRENKNDSLPINLNADNENKINDKLDIYPNTKYVESNYIVSEINDDDQNNSEIINDGIKSSTINKEEFENNYSNELNDMSPLEDISQVKNKDAITFDKNEEQNFSIPNRSNKQFNLSIKQSNYSDNEPYQLLSTAIHDQKINYKNPDVNLLNQQSSQTNINKLELETNARILQEKLETFKIFIEDLTVTPGPVVTQYEFVPAPGIKISKIESLTDDLAMALKAKGIRIIAPIPGKGTIGVEIPNNNPSIIRFGEIINSNKFINSNAKLPIALGKTISGEVFIADLTKMPHLLIAGSTGSGKSVGINTLITSLLYKMSPSELKFVIIDPKKVELRQYEGLAYHYIATSPDIEDIIVTKPEDAVVVLKAAVKEMELRYDILASVAQRNINDYNEKVANGTLKVKDNENHRKMPYIVVIIDELADLMLTASKEIEEPITRLAQMARAVGIHLVIATQRPSVDVITGIIKANFPARIAYLVASKIDSRTILDMQGAEQLLGQGDMLFLPSGQPKPVRIQNAFVTTDEVEAVCEYIASQKGYSEPYYLPTLVEKSNKSNINPEDRDELFEEAARLIIRTQQGSVSLLQRRLKIGYARAGRIVDELEAAGVVGPFDGSKARQVLMESESELEAVL